MSHEGGELKSVTRVAEARARLLEAVSPADRTDRVALGGAVGRALAEPVAAARALPAFDRAEVDGYAVRAADTAGAGATTPATLDVADVGPVGPGEAAPVDAGDAVPEGADAVAPVGACTATGGAVEVGTTVPAGGDVTPEGDDAAAGETLFDPGRRLSPVDCALLKAVGIDRVETCDPPTVGVVPAGDGLVDARPREGEAVETNALALARLADEWGAVPTDRTVVPAEPTALRAALERDLTKDVVVTTGLTGAGDDDVLPEVVEGIGDLIVHGIAAEPARTTALGVVRETPVVLAPGRPVAALVAAVQFLRPALGRAGGAADDPGPPAGHVARLGRKLRSRPGVRTFARVRLSPGGTGNAASNEDEDGNAGREATGDDALPEAIPVGDAGGRLLTSAALSDGWVVVPESAEGVPAGERVVVERWGWAA